MKPLDYEDDGDTKSATAICTSLPPRAPQSHIGRFALRIFYFNSSLSKQIRKFLFKITFKYLTTLNNSSNYKLMTSHLI